MEKRKWCVYLHTVHADCGYDKYYVGITSQHPKIRWGKLGNNYKGQLFWNAIQKYGWNNIDHKILHKDIEETEAKSLEQFYIKKYFSFDRVHGYNLTLGGDGSVGWHPSKQTREKISKSLSGELHPMYGKHLKEETRNKISSANKNRIWKESSKKKISDKAKLRESPMKGKEHSEESKAKMSENRIGKYLGENSGRSKKVYKYSLDGKYICEYINVQTVEDKLGISHALISKSCHNLKSSAGGFLWRYEKSDTIEPYEIRYKPSKKIEQYTLDNVLLSEYNDAKSIYNKFGYNVKTIRSCCSGSLKTAFGYIWRYAA